jgi:hypothetical protein
MSIEESKDGFLTLEKSAIKLEKVPESVVILEKVLFAFLKDEGTLLTYKRLHEVFLLHQTGSLHSLDLVAPDLPSNEVGLAFHKLIPIIYHDLSRYHGYIRFFCDYAFLLLSLILGV